jgi:hypothetical protein
MVGDAQDALHGITRHLDEIQSNMSAMDGRADDSAKLDQMKSALLTVRKLAIDAATKLEASAS